MLILRLFRTKQILSKGSDARKNIQKNMKKNIEIGEYRAKSMKYKLICLCVGGGEVGGVYMIHAYIHTKIHNYTHSHTDFHSCVQLVYFYVYFSMRTSLAICSMIIYIILFYVISVKSFSNFVLIHRAFGVFFLSNTNI